MTIITNSGKILTTGSTYIASRGLPAEYTRYGIDLDSQSLVGYTGRLPAASGSRSWTDGQLVGCAIWIARPCTLLGLMHFQTNTPTAATYDNNNKVGLYTSDGTDLTLVASTPNGGENMYSLNQTNQWRHNFFTDPLVVTAPTLMWAAAVSTWSSLTGSNQTYNCCGTLVNASASNPLGTSGLHRFWTVASQTDLPATQAWSGVTAATNAPLFFAFT